MLEYPNSEGCLIKNMSKVAHMSCLQCQSVYHSYEPPVYKIKDYDGELIDGTFYEAELQKVAVGKDKPSQVEEILDECIKHSKKCPYVVEKLACEI